MRSVTGAPPLIAGAPMICGTSVRKTNDPPSNPAKSGGSGGGPPPPARRQHPPAPTGPPPEERTRHPSPNVDVARGDRRSERQRRHRRGGVGPDAGQRDQDGRVPRNATAVVAHERSRRPVQRQRAAVVAEPSPRPQHRGRRRV